MDPCRIRTGAALLAALMLAGCAGTASSLNGASTFTPARTQNASAACTPTVWASSVGSNAVYGYTAANTAPCVTLTGPYNGINLSAPIALTLSVKPQWLYVADLSNDRIVVFAYQGVFVKAWTTNLSGQQYQPWGVCVSRKGIVGVGNRNSTIPERRATSSSSPSERPITADLRGGPPDNSSAMRFARLTKRATSSLTALPRAAARRSRIFLKPTSTWPAKRFRTPARAARPSR